jgi:serine/threonine-protein kinase
VEKSSELTLIAQLGRGGMADVFLAVRRGAGGFRKLVVIKRLRHLADHDIATMFRDEGRLAARLNHPNVVQTFRCEEEELEMEFLDGQSLHRIVKRGNNVGKKLDGRMTLHIMKGLLGALHHAHEITDLDGTPLNVIHRDVSPQNIFVTFEGKVKLIDFGIAKAVDQEEVTQCGMVKGKVRFMAPEQARAEALDRRVDVFAAGIVMWELLTGERYWGKTRELEIVRRLRDNELLPSPDDVSEDVPPNLAAICRKALAPDRDDRYATCAEFLAEVEAEIAPRTTVETELGELVSSLFAEERRQLRNIVEQTLARHTAPSSPSKMPPAGPDGSKSDMTAMPMTQTARPARSNLLTPMVAWLAFAALSLVVAATFLLVRLETAGAGTLARASAVGANPSGVPAATAPPSARVVPHPSSSSAADAGDR